MATPRTFGVATVVMALALTERRSMAEERPAVALRIEESFHSGCPKSPSTRERIEAHLGQVREAAPGEQAIELRFDVVRRGALSDGTLTLSFAGVSVERKASSKSCADVVAALSMMAAIAIGEETERRAGDSTVKEPETAEPTTPSNNEPVIGPATTPPMHTPPPSARETRRTREHRPPRRDLHHVRLSFGTGVEVQGNRGAVVMPSWFGQVTLPVPLDPSLRVGLGRTFGEDASSPRGDATIRWTVLTLAACGTLLRTERLQFGACVTGELGRLEAIRVDPLPANKLFYFWPTAGASGKLTWDVTREFSVDLAMGLRVPLIERELYFNSDRSTAVYQTPAIVPFVGLGAAVRLL